MNDPWQKHRGPAPLPTDEELFSFVRGTLPAAREVEIRTRAQADRRLARMIEVVRGLVRLKDGAQSAK